MNQADINAAAQALLDGKLLGLPTETVYGLAADASNDAALHAIFALKGRPQNHPLIIHLHDEAKLDDWAINIPQAARALADAFWPGPLTLILQRASHVSLTVTGGQDTVGLRCPAHDVAQAVLKRFAALGGSGAVAAPSANRFGPDRQTRNPKTRRYFRHANSRNIRRRASRQNKSKNHHCPTRIRIPRFALRPTNRNGAGAKWCV